MKSKLGTVSVVSTRKLYYCLYVTVFVSHLTVEGGSRRQSANQGMCTRRSSPRLRPQDWGVANFGRGETEPRWGVRMPPGGLETGAETEATSLVATLPRTEFCPRPVSGCLMTELSAIAVVGAPHLPPCILKWMWKGAVKHVNWTRGMLWIVVDGRMLMIRMGVGGFGWHALNFNTSAQYNLNEKMW